MIKDSKGDLTKIPKMSSGGLTMRDTLMEFRTDWGKLTPKEKEDITKNLEADIAHGKHFLADLLEYDSKAKHVLDKSGYSLELRNESGFSPSNQVESFFDALKKEAGNATSQVTVELTGNFSFLNRAEGRGVRRLRSVFDPDVGVTAYETSQMNVFNAMARKLHRLYLRKRVHEIKLFLATPRTQKADRLLGRLLPGEFFKGHVDLKSWLARFEVELKHLEDTKNEHTLQWELKPTTKDKAEAS